jgi:hypothetical protein
MIKSGTLKWMIYMGTQNDDDTNTADNDDDDDDDDDNNNNDNLRKPQGRETD